MLKVGLIGVGKMGLSHHAILGAHPDVQVSAICDNATYITSTLRKHVTVDAFKDYRKMIDSAGLDCVFVATPTSTHFDAASELAAARSRANQVGYHNRFIGTFQETRRLVQAGALGEVHHITGTAFGQVVIRAKSGSTWRSKKAEGGGCLHDYACHVIDLMNFVVGPPEKVVGAQLQKIYSRDVEDAV